jgi:hypothetical protein
MQPNGMQDAERSTPVLVAQHRCRPSYNVAKAQSLAANRMNRRFSIAIGGGGCGVAQRDDMQRHMPTQLVNHGAHEWGCNVST